MDTEIKLDDMIGRERELKIFSDEFTFVSEGGGSIKFLQGEYGSGKTFLARVVSEMALERDFAISWLSLNSEGNHFSEIDLIYNKICQSVRTRDYQRSVFRSILEEWLKNVENDLLIKRNLDNRRLNFFDRVRLDRLMYREIEERLNHIGVYNPLFANAVRNIYFGLKKENKDLISASVNWLKGSKRVTPGLKRRLKLHESVNKENVFEYLEAITKLISDTDYKGLFIVFDDVESIMALNKDMREAAYDNLCQFIDKIMYNNLKNVLLLFAATPEFLTDEEKGIPSYRALYERLNLLEQEIQNDQHRPVISLEGLTKVQLIDLSYKIRELHGKTNDWDSASAFNNQLIKALIIKHSSQADLVLPGDYISDLCNKLDLLQQNPDYDLKSELIIDNNDEKVKEDN